MSQGFKLTFSLKSFKYISPSEISQLISRLKYSIWACHLDVSLTSQVEYVLNRIFTPTPFPTHSPKKNTKNLGDILHFLFSWTPTFTVRLYLELIFFSPSLLLPPLVKLWHATHMFCSYINQTKPHHSFTYNSTVYFYCIYDKHKSKEMPPQKSYMNKLLLASPFKFIKCFLPMLKLCKSLNFQNMLLSCRGSIFMAQNKALLGALFSRLSVFLVSSLSPPSTSMSWPFHLKQPLINSQSHNLVYLFHGSSHNQSLFPLIKYKSVSSTQECMLCECGILCVLSSAFPPGLCHLTGA